MAEGKKAKKAGRDAKGQAHKNYLTSNTRSKRKIVNIARSNGYDHALAYAGDHMLTTWAKTRLKNFTFGRS